MSSYKDAVSYFKDRLWCRMCRSCIEIMLVHHCIAGKPEIKSVQKLPEDLEKDTTHSYGPDSFKLHRELPAPVPGLVLGLLGPHGIGKTTALKALAGLLKPNLGRFNDPPDWPEILTHCHDQYLKTYFTKIVDKKLKVAFKPQHFQGLRGEMIKVEELLKSFNERDKMEEICDALELNKFRDLRLHTLSPGALHRVVIATVALQKADVYIFDEMSNFLDVSQRFKAAQLIRSLKSPDSFVIVVENDLSVLDYMSDYIYHLYGKPKACGVVAHKPCNVSSGIDGFLFGFNPKEDRRIRGESMRFEVARTVHYDHYHNKNYSFFRSYTYPNMTVSHSASHFKLELIGGEFFDAQILVVLGESGTGKSTFLQMLAGRLQPDKVEGVEPWSIDYVASYKPQEIELERECTVRELLEREDTRSYMHRDFVSDVMKPLQIEPLLDQKVGSLSPGERQMVAITLCLAEDAELFLIDEPCAYLDADARIRVAMAIRHHILREHRAAVIVEHDFLMASYLADHVIVVEATSSPCCYSSMPTSQRTEPFFEEAGYHIPTESENLQFHTKGQQIRVGPGHGPEACRQVLRRVG
ncbi:unnamed protein product, partial [Thlaspi arvense]